MDSLKELKDKIMLLENAVLNGSAEEVSALFRELDAAEFSARALGLACRFRGVDMVRALAECGASFRCPKQESFRGFMKIHHSAAPFDHEYTGRWEDYSLMILEPCRTLIVEGITSVGYDDDFGYISKAEDGGVLHVSERLKVLDYLCGCSDIGFDKDNVFYFSILTDCSEFYGALKERGSALPENIRASLIKGGNEWNIFSAILHLAPSEVFPRAVERLAAELSPGERMKYNDTFFEIHKNLFTDPKNLELVLEHFDCSKMKQTKTLKFLINNDAAGCLALLENAGWLKQNRRRDELIQYASEGGRTECAAWLLDFKNRTADLAAERERAERKMQRELNAAPGSITAMKQIWSYTKLDDGTLRITNYKGRQTEVVIPEMIGKHRVSDIGRAAFSGDKYIAVRADPKQVEFRKGITKITIPEGITVIGANAFSNIEKIKTMELPSTVREIGDFAFYGCEGLEKIVFTGETSLIGDDALCDCDALQEVIFAEGVRKIKLGTDALENCERLKRVVLPSTLRSITLDDGEFFVPDFCTDAWVIVPRGSFAEKYCKKHDIEYKYPEE